MHPAASFSQAPCASGSGRVFPWRAAVLVLATALVGMGASGCHGCGSDRATSDPASEAAGHAPLATALEGLEVRDDQRPKVQAAAARIEAQTQVAHVAKQRLVRAVADGVRKNALDRAALDAKIAEVKGAAVAAQAGTQQVFEEMHSLLDLAQRKALLAGMRGANAARQGKKGELRPLGEDIVSELGIAPQEMAAIRVRLREHVQSHPHPESSAKHRPPSERIHAFAAAFEGDTFDPKSPDLDLPDGGAAAERTADTLVAAAEAMLPSLNAAQRETLAKKIEERGEPR